MAERRTGFAPTVGLGLAAGALGAVAAAKPWFRLAQHSSAPAGPVSQTTIDMPLALALSLVVLAGWGVLLVTRGGLRRVAVGVALAGALGVAACVIRAPFALPDDLRTRLGPVATGEGVDATGWYATAAGATLLSVVALAVAWRRAPLWPAMSSRYDAPASRPAVVDPTDQKDLWKALDEGVDPTDSEGSPSP
ncbi:Trp biosynthesis-associated membrane protein [Nocardioides pocheonensis]|uniref:TIGR02234 family membrane protein n=1 Tax=Nocardioides pocheonensis TaxID=661485 RepID=A0A3N0GU58_9ACTN|nr:Trp biosynthesis-associated membrane protein [Nocardioides pocheonensis]RNM16003.1 hypothetical protein EFL26_07565 [Nocardioides pocheonensis]